MRARHFFQLVGLSALWGASFLFLRVASPVLGPAVLAEVRVALASLTLAGLMVALRHRWPLAHWRELAWIALLSVALPFLLFAWAALRLPAGYSALLNSTAVLFACLFSAWLGEDRLNWRKWLGCLCGFAGVGAIVRLGPAQPTHEVVLAALACVAAAACYGLSSPLMKRATKRMEPLAIAACIHGLSFVMLLPTAAWGWSGAHWTPLALAAVAVLGVVTSGLAYWANLRIVRHVSPIAAVSPTFLIPAFGVAWGHLFLGEPVGSGFLLGAGLVLLAAGLVSGFNPLRARLDADSARP